MKSFKLIISILLLNCILLANELDDNLSLEDLMNIEVTSISKKEESAFTASSAIYVISQAEMKSKGASNLAEALRGTPGVQVSRRTNNSWEVSIRGFDSLYSNKLLVLIDGRTVYTPIFSGTYWNFTNYPIADIERIEVIRGPGASMWGSNAVNGVINITTKHSKDTLGGLSKLEYGEDFQQAYLRIGETLDEEGKLNLRAYGQFQKYDTLNPGSKNKHDQQNDDWDHAQGGFRLDYDVTPKDTIKISGDAYSVDQVTFNSINSNSFYEDSDATGYNLSLDYTKQISTDEKFHALIYYDFYDFNQEFTTNTYVQSWNFEFDYHFSPIKNHDVTIGAGTRLYRSQVKDPSGQLRMFPVNENTTNYNFFIQDKITLQPNRWTLTLGSKFEEHDYSGFDYQPSARLAYTPNRKNTLWLAASRAVRTPNRYEHNSNLFFGAVVGNHDVDSETVKTYEAGYRVLATEKLSFDFTVFYNDYSDLTTTKVTTGDNLIVNDASADSYGFEVSSNYLATNDWQLKLSYSYFDIDTDQEKDNASYFPTDNVTAQHQASVYSFYRISKELQWDLTAYYQDTKDPSINDVKNTSNQAFIKLDTKFTWTCSPKLEIYVAGQNLLEDSTSETLYYVEAPRTFLMGLNYRF
ncbi:TonB-dependent receptor [Lentisphaera profundi]|uniref:TonB-dependent receptor n=1 Tax=Lentisphaera profundi TaxID=1658616 RepID=A0ABY7VNY3_9BACT|nr:TonB-dependent receptor [Lentisphaera profundi]WDE95657.1 TonB-dependent receptor [Lentisphaera profundi]